MADIKQAIEAAKQNPNSAFATELRKRIESGKMDAELKAAGMPTFGKKSFTERVKEDFSKRGDRISSAVAGEGEFSGQSTLRRSTDAVTTALGGVLNTAYEAAPQPVRKGIDFVEKKIGEGVQVAADKLAETELIKGAAAGDTAGLEDALGIAANAGQIAGQVTAIGGGVKTAQAGANVAKNAGTTLARSTKEIASKLKANKNNIPNILGNDVDPNLKNLFKEATPEKYDKILEVVKNSADDIRNESGFEYVGNKMEESLVQLNKRKASIGQQKSNIINKAKVGLQDFTPETRNTILDIQRALPDDAVAKSFIAKLKNVRTKLDADKVIDDMQDTLYTGNRNLTIPEGSRADLVLRKAIGKYNSQLKKSLPPAYSKLNDEYASLAQNTSTINRALGEVVNGQATRGASLIKQFFSPSGTKAKELFKFVKDKTGIDLAQDTALAKFFMEVFDDPRSRSLLEGIPRTKQGLVDTIINFTTEKTGITKGLSDVIKDQTIKKGRKLTNPKP